LTIAALLVLGACGLGVVGSEITAIPDGLDSSTRADSMVDTGGPIEPDGTTSVDPDASDASDAGPCATDGGGKMVSVDGRFCIDAIETTNADYLPFLLAAQSGDAGPVPSHCAWNTSYRPPSWASAPPYFPTEESAIPVHPVDWCDAWMFCQWSGKRLCGSLEGTAMPPEGAPDAATNAWSYACSAAGTKAYPYGTSYDGNACNTDKGGSAEPVEAGAYPGCVGGYPGIFDMSGNAWEWDDSCGPGNQTAPCRLRGGSATRPANTVSCATALDSPRDDATGNNGIRCCRY
jgi:formylglycine-generating enzyme